ncbi:hypothetical protein C4D60_Mb06t17420 [Musa balbisiana]|uniref:Plantacyanin n=1 Tax=Musa balbisiana TaxID=52838 RepID=A0A4S8INN9_MUSBA|nr:hypothetical protein C4D60_Mb06t17420 [Musa balbisiana]
MQHEVRGGAGHGGRSYVRRDASLGRKGKHNFSRGDKPERFFNRADDRYDKRRDGYLRRNEMHRAGYQSREIHGGRDVRGRERFTGRYDERNMCRQSGLVSRQKNGSMIFSTKQIEALVQRMKKNRSPRSRPVRVDKIEASDVQRKYDSRIRAHAGDNDEWRHDGFYDLEVEAAASRKRPAFSERKLPTGKDSVATPPTGRKGKHNFSRGDKPERFFNRADDRYDKRRDGYLRRNEMHRAGYQSREIHGGRDVRGRERFTGRYDERNMCRQSGLVSRQKNGSMIFSTKQIEALVQRMKKNRSPRSRPVRVDKIEASDVQRKYDSRIRAHAGDNDEWRHDGFYDLEVEAAASRKRPAFSERKLPTGKDSVATPPTGRKGKHNFSRGDKPERFFNRADDRYDKRRDGYLRRNEMHRAGYQSREIHGGRDVRGRERFTGRYDERNMCRQSGLVSRQKNGSMIFSTKQIEALVQRMKKNRSPSFRSLSVILKTMAGRSNIAALALVCLCLSYHLEITAAAEIPVGDSDGWSFDIGNWPNGKTFKAGDVLVFKYDKGSHNVVVVDAEGYNSCTSKSGSKTYTSGTDKITLAKGTSYFICSYAGHCDAGMKIKVVAN